MEVKDMKSNPRASLAFIVSRLISGRRTASLYDFSVLRHVEIASLPYAVSLKEFDKALSGYIPGHASDCHYTYTCINTGMRIHITVNGDSFIGHINGSAEYFVGNVRGDIIDIFDHRESSHFLYKISGCIVERNNTAGVCNNCWYIK